MGGLKTNFLGWLLKAEEPPFAVTSAQAENFNHLDHMLKIHHLGRSQSERIVWLCEELKGLHPLGAAPLIEDGNLLMAESAAIVEYIIVKHGGGRLKLGPERPDYATFLYWFHPTATCNRGWDAS